MIKNDQIFGGLLGLCGVVLLAGKAIIIKWIYIHHEIGTLPLLALRMIFSVPFYIIILFNKNKGSDGAGGERQSAIGDYRFIGLLYGVLSGF